MNGMEKALKEKAEAKRKANEDLKVRARKLKADGELQHHQLAHRLGVSATKLYSLLKD